MLRREAALAWALVVVKLSRAPWGSGARQPFHVPCSLFVGNRLHTPRASLGPTEKIPEAGGQGRAWTQRQGKSSAASGRVWSASRDTHDRIFELFTERKPPTSRRCQQSLFRGRLVLMLSRQVDFLQPVAHRAPLSMGFPRQEYCRGLPFPPPGDLPNSGTKPPSPALAGRFITAEQPGKQGRPPEAR